MSPVFVLTLTVLVAVIVVLFVIKSTGQIGREVIDTLSQDVIEESSLYAELLAELPVNFLSAQVILWLKNKCLESGLEPTLHMFEVGEDRVLPGESAHIHNLLNQLISLIKSGAEKGEIDKDESDSLQANLQESIVKVEALSLYNQAQVYYNDGQVDKAQAIYNQLLSLCVRLPYAIMSSGQLEIVNARKFELESKRIISNIFDSQSFSEAEKTSSSQNVRQLKRSR